MIMKRSVAVVLASSAIVFTPSVRAADNAIINQLSNPVCFICGAVNFVATNLLEPIDALNLLPLDLQPLAEFTCDALAIAGLRGLIPTDVCYELQSDELLRDLCGCMETLTEEAVGENAADDGSPTPEPVDAKCYICGSNDAVLGKPNAVLPVPEEFNSPFQVVKCSTLDSIGRSGLVPPEACEAAVNSVALQQTCGCEAPIDSDFSEEGGPDSLAPSDEPTAAPIVSEEGTAAPTLRATSSPRDAVNAASKESSAVKLQQSGSVLVVLLLLSLV